MKFREWWGNESPKLTAGVAQPALVAAIRQAAYEAWIMGAYEGRQNAANGGKLFRLLHKIMSRKCAKVVSNKIASFIF